MNDDEQNSYEQNDACHAAAAMANAFPGASAYAEYCRLRISGLRKQAFVRLESFLDEVLRWDQEAQRDFVGRISHIVETAPAGGHPPCPTPLVLRLIMPTLRAWADTAHASDPLRWLGMFTGDLQSTKAAFARDPLDVRARLTFTKHLIGHASFATHHLPDYFIGKPEDALAALEEANDHLTIITSLGGETEYLRKESVELGHVIEDWIASGGDGRASFLAYRQAQGRAFTGGCAAYYYTKKHEKIP